MGRWRKGVIEQSCKRQKIFLKSVRVPRKPTFVDIPDDTVDAMKRMDPQEVGNIPLTKEFEERHWLSKFG